MKNPRITSPIHSRKSLVHLRLLECCELQPEMSGIVARVDMNRMKQVYSQSNRLPCQSVVLGLQVIGALLLHC